MTNHLATQPLALLVHRFSEMEKVMKLPELWQRIDSALFPDIPDQNRSLPLWQYLLFVLAGVAVFSFIGSFLPATGFWGYDWVYYFSTGERGPGLAYYPPWVTYLRYLPWPVLIGLTFTGLALALYQRRASPLVMVVAFVTLPVLWVVFLGQVEGLVLLGLTGLPWLVPLAVIKPQVAYFAFLARKQYFLALLVWFAISIAIWGLWPFDMLKISVFTGMSHDINLWPWSLPLVIILLWLSRGDMDLLMLAGTFLLPYLHPYHYFVVVPALARVEKWVAVLAAAISWLPLLANWLGPRAWFLGHLFPLLLWLSLYAKRRALQNSAPT